MREGVFYHCSLSSENMETNSQTELTSIRAISESDPVMEPLEILKPSLNIRSQLGEEDAIQLARRLYGISTRNVFELLSYNDRNFLIHVDT